MGSEMCIRDSDEAMADYKKQVGAKCDAVVKSLNETLKK